MTDLLFSEGILHRSTTKLPCCDCWWLAVLHRKRQDNQLLVQLC